MDLAEWSQEWLELKREYCKPTSMATYRWRVARLIAPRVGDVGLEEASSATFRQLGVALAREGYSTRTVSGALATLKGMLRSAAMAGLVEPREWVYEVPRCADADADRGLERLTDSQAREAMAALVETVADPAQGALARFRKRPTYPPELESDRRRAMLCALALGCGLRIGEACALRRSDVDAPAAQVTVAATSWEWTEGGHVEREVGSPKTSSSRRVVPMERSLADALAPHVGGSGYLGTGTGSPCDKRALRKWWGRFQDALSIPRVRFHALRHTYGSMLIESGADPKTVSQLMGHADVTTTLKIYAHPDAAAMRSAVAGLGMLPDRERKRRGK